MAKKGQKFRKHSEQFKLHIVRLRLGKSYSLGQISKMYNLSHENVIKWTRRFLNGEPLTMKRGRPPKSKESRTPKANRSESPEEELKRLRAELAYKDKIIEFLEEREHVKKKRSSES